MKKGPIAYACDKHKGGREGKEKRGPQHKRHAPGLSRTAPAPSLALHDAAGYTRAPSMKDPLIFRLSILAHPQALFAELFPLFYPFLWA
jgi:hypothetical protein